MTDFLHHCPAPAKLNLFLHVVGQRPDGYHLLQTVFQLIDLGDILHFTLRKDSTIERTSHIEGIPQEQDLAIRAARLLQAEIFRRTGKKPGASIALEKKLPVGAGLGGGSSNAATTLLALDHLWKSGLDRHELMDLGLQLGADVPFFVFGRTAFAEGVGEILSPVDTPDSWFVVIDPGIYVSTRAIFESNELTRNTEKIKIEDFPASFAEIAQFGKNDLQYVTGKLYPPVVQVLEWMGRYGHAKMTGSGSCVFAHFNNEADADEVVRNVPQPWRGWKARGLRKHPLDFGQ